MGIDEIEVADKPLTLAFAMFIPHTSKSASETKEKETISFLLSGSVAFSMYKHCFDAAIHAA